MMGISFVKSFRKKALRQPTFSACAAPHFYSMKITEDVRKFAAQQKISEERAVQVGLKQVANSPRKAASYIS